MSANDPKALFATHCKLTCLGGSECGECECSCPDDCELRDHPGFEAARAEAQKRIKRFGPQKANA